MAEGDGGARLDAFVGRRLGVSVGAARRLIDAGHVRIDGRRRAKGVTVAAGATVTVTGRATLSGAVVADPSTTIAVIHEDPALIAIDKPAGMPSHPLRGGERGTAANMIVARFPECADASLEPREGGLGHRLDTATSGVLIAARTREAWLGLRRALGADDCQKRYLAEVWGQPPDEGAIAADIGRRGRRGTTVRLDGGRNPLPARTSWTVLARRGATTLVEARLHAGRAHQVRAHLAAAGFPIVGDDRYGAGRTPAMDGGPTLHLHAAAVAFRHPTTGAPLIIEAPPPLWARLPADGPVPRPFAV
ncbi:MAG TPA: RluA family pseudouridine synthase [Polyangia bacterium]